MEKEFVLSISYGNYLIQNGGTDKVIREHRDIFLKMGVNYVFLFPVCKNMTLFGKKIEIHRWGLNIGNEFVGIYDFNGILAKLYKLKKEKYVCKAIFIHHLWRIVLPELETILDSYNAAIYYYLHDMYSVCNDNNMLRRNGKYCGYGLSIQTCKNKCEYKELSVERRRTFNSLLKKYALRIQCIAPSPCVKKIYDHTFSRFSDKIIVIPHQKQSGTYVRDKSKGTTLRIAFVGAQKPNKGWNMFKDLIFKFGSNPNYEFFYFGNGTEQLEFVKNIEVSVQKDGQNAMVEALRKYNVDVVLLLSTWPETYSYTYYESYAAGCYVVALRVSGNIADMVEKNKNGHVFVDSETLIEYFQDSDRIAVDVQDFNFHIKYFPLDLQINDDICEKIKRCSSFCVLKKKAFINKDYLCDLIYRVINKKQLDLFRKN